MEISLTPTTTAPPNNFHADVEYYLEPFIFKVGDSLFRVPKKYFPPVRPRNLNAAKSLNAKRKKTKRNNFSQESEIPHSSQVEYEFPRDMFQLARPAGEDDLKGSSDSNPYVLPDTISTNAFRSFVKLLYHPSPSLVELSIDECVAVLELAKLWNMDNLQGIITAKLLSLLNDNPAQQWSLAKSHNIHSWVRPALEKLIRRNEPLGVRDYELLDQDVLLKIAIMRECCYPVYHDTMGYGINTDIHHWEIRQQRGATNVQLDSLNLFHCPAPLSTNVEITSHSEGSSDLKDAEFYFEKVVFKVEHRLYKVPNQPFVQHSPIFRSNFERRGFAKYDHNDPYIIESDVKATDFANLLRFFFPPQLIEKHERTSDEWTSIMRLAARWEMKELKDLAVQHLTQTSFGTVENKLRLAIDLGIESWFREGMVALVTRQEPITISEWNVLGRDNMLQIIDLRERSHSRQAYSYGWRVELHDERGALPDSVDLSSRLNAAGL